MANQLKIIMKFLQHLVVTCSCFKVLVTAYWLLEQISSLSYTLFQANSKTFPEDYRVSGSSEERENSWNCHSRLELDQGLYQNKMQNGEISYQSHSRDLYDYLEIQWCKFSSYIECRISAILSKILVHRDFSLTAMSSSLS